MPPVKLKRSRTGMSNATGAVATHPSAAIASRASQPSARSPRIGRPASSRARAVRRTTMSTTTPTATKASQARSPDVTCGAGRKTPRWLMKIEPGRATASATAGSDRKTAK